MVIQAIRVLIAPVIAKILVAGVLFVTLYNVVAFSASTDDAVDRSFSDDADVNMYGLIDTLRDPEAFSTFRDSLSDLHKLAAFYNDLTDDGDLSFLSSFDQTVPVQDFRGDSTFEDGYGTELGTRGPYVDEVSGRRVFDTKALEINRAAFEFYNLQTDGGASLPWRDIDFDNVTPVLLGSNYRGLYNSGDTFVGSLYSDKVTFEVAGFLAPNSSIYYHDDIDFFLDSHIVIPYPEYLGVATEATKEFDGILSFAMINGDLAAAKAFTPDDIIDRLASIGTRTGFDDYTLLNLSPYLTQYTLTKKVIKSNLTLVASLEVALALGALVALYALNRFLFFGRAPRYRIAWLSGATTRRLSLLALPSLALAHGGIAVVLAVAYQQLPQRSEVALTPVLAAFVALVVIDIAHHVSLMAQIVSADSEKNR